MNKYSLPTEIYEHILHFLSIKDIVSCSQINSGLAVVCRNELFWYKIFQRQCPTFDISYDQPLKSTWKQTVLKFPRSPNEPILLDNLHWRIDQGPKKLKYRRKEYSGPLILNIPATRVKLSKVEYELVTINKPQLDGGERSGAKRSEAKRSEAKRSGVVTVKDILQTIFDYYQQPLTYDQIVKYVSQGLHYLDLIFAGAAVNNGEFRQRLDIMGHKIHFKGLRKDNDVYRIHLG